LTVNKERKTEKKIYKVRKKKGEINRRIQSDKQNESQFERKKTDAEKKSDYQIDRQYNRK
jgi:hypothetical protein